jgi:hypothetical protein
MSVKDWRSLLSRIQLIGKPKPVKSNTIKDFEKATGFLLPSSYCDYCKVFGAGVLERPDCYEISVPGASVERFKLELNCKFYFHKGIAYPKALLSHKKQLQRAWVFAKDISRSKFFWDPMETTNNNEYPVYIIDEYYNIERIADTFWNFVNDICLGSGPPNYSEYSPVAVFEASE